MIQNPVTGIDVAHNIALITLDNFPNDIRLISDMFSSIAKDNINIDMISKSTSYKGNINISFTLSSADLIDTIMSLNRFSNNDKNFLVEVDAYNSKVSVLGKDMQNTPGIAAKLFRLFADQRIEIKLVSASESGMSFIVHERDTDTVVESIKKAYSLN
ncbi:MAG TPA: ACT domain-containing protein [Acetivibrio sp.]|nr:ACT domain-containing protein [Clostridium sp.]HOQ38597.1 ACT domain-containing protein [Acetivibrio sp.]HQA58900.1 ACT domain-containing protein [Acetivibrio sp.]